MESKNSDKKIFQIAIDPINNRHLDIEVPDRALRLSDLVPVMHTITDVLVEITTSLSDIPITCGLGCGVCCKQLVPLSIPEVFYVAEKLLALPLNQRGRYLTLFEENEKILEKKGFIGILKSIDQTKNDKEVAKNYFGLNLFCPFLTNQSCSIHSWRPVVCREFNSLSDPLLCEDPFSNSVKALQYPQRPSSVLAKLCSMLTETPSIFAPVPLLFEYLELFNDISLQEWDGDFLIKELLDLVFENLQCNER